MDDVRSVLLEWIRRAEDDLRSAQALLKLDPVPEGNVQFALHQCAEKWLKAYLISLGQDPPFTHALVQLLDLCAATAPELERLRESCRALTPYALWGRYPLAPGDRGQSLDALLTHAMEIRSALRRLVLGE